MKIYSYYGSRNIVGSTIRELRKDRKMSQNELAEQMQLRGVSINELAILRIEKALRFVTDYEVRAFAEIFQIPLEQLYS